MVDFLTRLICSVFLILTITIPVGVVSLLLWDFYYADQLLSMVARTFKTKD